MSRQEISKARLDEIINDKIPDLEQLRNKSKVLNPQIISSNFGHNSRIPLASVCLKDSLSVLDEARYALRESYAHEVWYKVESQKVSESTANYFMRYYSADVALRLYSANEHLANAIICSLTISKKSLQRHQKKLSSVSSTVGKYLVNQRPKHPITLSVLQLINNSSWKETITYRNKWVHEKPPLVSGLGIQWLRKTRWTKIIKEGTEAGYQMKCGGMGDKPDYSPEQLRLIVTEALFAFVKTYGAVLDYYIEYLEQKGII